MAHFSLRLLNRGLESCNSPASALPCVQKPRKLQIPSENVTMLTAHKVAVAPSKVALPVRSARAGARKTVVCSARKPEQPSMAQPVVAAVAAAMLMGAAMPDDALAARSGGRVGGTASRWDVCVCK